MKKVLLDIGEKEKVLNLVKALSSQTRLDIIELLNTNSYHINEISQKLGIPLSTVAVSIKALEEVGLIAVEKQPGTRGGMKLCSRKIDAIDLRLTSSQVKKRMKSTYVSLPIGSYSECKIAPNCGLASSTGIIENEDDSKVFYSPKRFEAQLLWFSKGYLEYRVPVNIPENAEIQALEITLEICSEAPNYQMDWPSDIFFWVNGVEIGKWTSPGDLGGRRGRLNPEWWADDATQYGFLRRIYIDKEKTCINEEMISRVQINDLELNREEYITFRIGTKENARNIGGINIFGEEFGDFPQNIVVRFVHD